MVNCKTSKSSSSDIRFHDRIQELVPIVSHIVIYHHRLESPITSTILINSSLVVALTSLCCSCNVPFSNAGLRGPPGIKTTVFELSTKMFRNFTLGRLSSYFEALRWSVFSCGRDAVGHKYHKLSPTHQLSIASLIPRSLTTKQ